MFGLMWSRHKLFVTLIQDVVVVVVMVAAAAAVVAEVMEATVAATVAVEAAGAMVVSTRACTPVVFSCKSARGRFDLHVHRLPHDSARIILLMISYRRWPRRWRLWRWWIQRWLLILVQSRQFDGCTQEDAPAALSIMT